jgi:hypothetical protein
MRIDNSFFKFGAKRLYLAQSREGLPGSVMLRRFLTTYHSPRVILGVCGYPSSCLGA